MIGAPEVSDADRAPILPKFPSAITVRLIGKYRVA